MESMEKKFTKELQENTGISKKQAEKVVSFLRTKYNEIENEPYNVLYVTEETLEIIPDNAEISTIETRRKSKIATANTSTAPEDDKISTENNEGETIEDGGYMRGNRAVRLMEDELYRAASTNGNGTSIGSLNKR